MIRNNVEVRLIIKGRPITEFPHNGEIFVEGREGSNFEIEVINHNPFRVEAVISVDGLSVIDGKEAGEESSGYLLEANQTTRIPGWKLDSQSVAAFVFSGKNGSYAAQATGSAANTGVIGVMAFRERYSYTSRIAKSAFSNGGLRGMTLGLASPSTSAMWSDTSERGLVGSMATFNSISTSTSSLLADTTATASVQNLGTGFGQRQDFSTRTVDFTRGDMLCIAVMYYDSITGLRARGVPMERVQRRTYQATPQAFPKTTGCKPPHGWRG